MNLAVLIPQTAPHNVGASQTQANAAYPAADTSPPQTTPCEQTNRQPPQTASGSVTENSAQNSQNTNGANLLSSAKNKEETMRLLNSIMQRAMQGGEKSESGANAATVVSIDKLASIAHGGIKATEAFAKLMNELMIKIDNSDSFSAQEKELARAILREIEAVLRKSSPASVLSQQANTLAKNISVQDFFKWTAQQIKAGNLAARDFFSITQILLGNNAIDSNAEKSEKNEIASPRPQTQNYAETGAGRASETAVGSGKAVSANSGGNESSLIRLQNPTATQEQLIAGDRQSATANITNTNITNTTANITNTNIANIPLNIANITTNIPEAAANVAQTVANTANAATVAGEKPFVPANFAAANPQNVVFVKQSETDIRANIQNLIRQTQNESVKILLNQILQAPPSKTADCATFSFVKIEGKADGAARFLPLTLHTQFNNEFCALLGKNFPEFSKQLLNDAANIIRTSPKSMILTQEIMENLKSVLKNLSQSVPRDESPAANNKNPAAANPVFTPQQSTAASEGITGQISKNSIQAPQVQLTAAAQIQKPTTAQTQTVASDAVNSNITANSVQTPQLQTQTTALTQATIPQTPSVAIPSAAAATPIAMTPSLLSSLLQYIAHTNSNETVLQSFRTLFATEKSVENISAQMREFLQNLPTELRGQNSVAQIWTQMQGGLEKLGNIENILRNPEIIFKNENPIDFLMAKIGILQGGGENLRSERDGKQSQSVENLRNILREISNQIKESAQKLQDLPNLRTDERLSEAFSRLRTLANSVNELSQKTDSANLLANKVDITAGRSEQTVIVPVQIGNAWIQMELRINRDEKNGQEKNGKKQAQEVEVTVELDSGNSVWAKANLTLEKQLQVAMNFTNEKMLEYFKQNYKEFYETLESIGTDSVRVSFNKKTTEEERKEKSAAQNGNLDVTG